MFAGKIDDLKFRVVCPPAVQRMLEILNDSSLLTKECGKYEVGEGMFYVLMTYDTVEEVRPETHRKYIDVQVVLKGRERMGWSPLLADSLVSVPYNVEKDIMFYREPEQYSYIACSVGACNLFFPHDIHAPGLVYKVGMPEAVRKVVGKIPVELISSDFGGLSSL